MEQDLVEPIKNAIDEINGDPTDYEAGVFDPIAFAKTVRYFYLLDYSPEDIERDDNPEAAYMIYYAFKLMDGETIEPINPYEA